MAESFLLGAPHAGGTIQSAMHFEDDDIIFTDVMPASEVQKIIDWNAAEKAMEQKPTGPNGHGAVAARLPLPMWQAWQNEWKRQYKPYIK